MESKSLVVIDCLRRESVSKLARCNASLYGTNGKIIRMARSVAVLALRINMREARCETPGVRIPLLGGYRSSKRLADLWREYSLSSVV